MVYMIYRYDARVMEVWEIEIDASPFPPVRIAESDPSVPSSLLKRIMAP